MLAGLLVGSIVNVEEVEAIRTRKNKSGRKDQLSDTMLNLKEFQESKDSIQSSIIQSLLMELVRDTEEIHELYIQED